MSSPRVASALASTLLFLSVLASAATFAQEDCNANVNATLDSKQEGGETTKFQFVVEVDTNESCAHIEYDLVLEELMPNGQTKRVRKTRHVKLNDGSLEEHVRHEMPSSYSLLSYEARHVQCTPCDLMP